MTEQKQAVAQAQMVKADPAEQPSVVDGFWRGPKTQFLEKVKASLEVKPSSIKVAGSGLFTNMDLPANTIVMYYEGEVCSEAEYERRAAADECTYMKYVVNRDMYVDGAKAGSSKARFINHKSKDECQLDWGDDGAIFTLRAVKAGEELFINYGENYWSEEVRGFCCCFWLCLRCVCCCFFVWNEVCGWVTHQFAHLLIVCVCGMGGWVSD